MAAFLFRCPNTALLVQGWLADAEDDAAAEADDTETYEEVSCSACSRVHFVNVKTGRLLGSDE